MGKRLFSFYLAGGAHGGRRDSHGIVWCLMDGYELFVDIFWILDRRQQRNETINAKELTPKTIALRGRENSSLT